MRHETVLHPSPKAGYGSWTALRSCRSAYPLSRG